mmetsp:Transcript_46061/g.72098  ORF Transcript_46061/g.72098 Transcript_46061/m.72098 type:complete len:246 (-) Transcript_46061:352-1089(-)
MLRQRALQITPLVRPPLRLQILRPMLPPRCPRTLLQRCPRMPRPIPPQKRPQTAPPRHQPLQLLLWRLRRTLLWLQEHLQLLPQRRRRPRHPLQLPLMCRPRHPLQLPLMSPRRPLLRTPPRPRLLRPLNTAMIWRRLRPPLPLHWQMSCLSVKKLALFLEHTSAPANIQTLPQMPQPMLPPRCPRMLLPRHPQMLQPMLPRRRLPMAPPRRQLQLKLPPRRQPMVPPRHQQLLLLLWRLRRTPL